MEGPYQYVLQNIDSLTQALFFVCSLSLSLSLSLSFYFLSFLIIPRLSTFSLILLSLSLSLSLSQEDEWYSILSALAASFRSDQVKERGG